MALKIALKNSKGAVALYHRIAVVSQVHIKDQEGIHINLAGYADETYRETEKQNGEELVLTNTPIFLPFLDENFTRENLYTRIKAEVAEFVEAEDC